MNIDAYNLDSLRALVRKLEKENQNLKQKLNEANIPYNSESILLNPREKTQNMIWIGEAESWNAILRKIWRNGIFLCSGEETMYMRNVEAKVVIFHNVTIAGMTDYARSKRR